MKLDGTTVEYSYDALGNRLSKKGCKTPPVLTGDVNGDGQVNITDVTNVIGHILGKTPEPFVVAAADANGDGVVNVSDVTFIINIILKR